MTSAPILNISNSNLGGKNSKTTAAFEKTGTSKFYKVMKETSSKTSQDTSSKTAQSATAKTAQDISSKVSQSNLQETENSTSAAISQNAEGSQSNNDVNADIANYSADRQLKNDGNTTENTTANTSESLSVETVSTVMDSIKNTLLKNLNITEEELKQSMEAMGITYMDLLNTNVLIDFVAQNYQISDSLEMVTNQGAYESLKNLMAAMKEIVAGNSGSINSVDLTNAIPLMENNDSSGQIDATTVNLQSDAGKLQVSDSKDRAANTELTSTSGTVVTTEGNVDLKAIQNADSKENGMSFQNPEADSAENVVETQNQLNPENETEGFSEELLQSKESAIPKKTVTDMQAADTAVDVQVPQNSMQQSVLNSVSIENTVSEQTEMDSIIKQLVEKIKVTVTPDVKQIEMQLQPENLGKINLHLTAKEGIITAHIITQSEVVKEAVESQIGQLKEQFAQQGIQVKAVDVSVSSQGFDENLWQGGQQGQDEQGSKNNGNTRYKRNLQINLLDSSQTELNEGELLEAEIMKQNGTNVSYLA